MKQTISTWTTSSDHGVSVSTGIRLSLASIFLSFSSRTQFGLNNIMMEHKGNLCSLLHTHFMYRTFGSSLMIGIGMNI